jgi:hypothetical protein
MCFIRDYVLGLWAQYIVYLLPCVKVPYSLRFERGSRTYVQNWSSWGSGP